MNSFCTNSLGKVPFTNLGHVQIWTNGYKFGVQIWNRSHRSYHRQKHTVEFFFRKKNHVFVLLRYNVKEQKRRKEQSVSFWRCQTIPFRNLCEISLRWPVLEFGVPLFSNRILFQCRLESKTCRDCNIFVSHFFFIQSSCVRLFIYDVMFWSSGHSCHRCRKLSNTKWAEHCLQFSV